MKNFPLSSSLQWVPMVKKRRNQTNTNFMFKTHSHGWSPAPSSLIYPNQWEHKPEIHLLCATLVVIFHPGRWVRCWISSQGFPHLDFQQEKQRDSVHTAGTGMWAVHSECYSLWTSAWEFILALCTFQAGSWLGLQVPMARWQLQNRLTSCRASQDLWLSMAYKRSESTAKINSFKNLSK